MGHNPVRTVVRGGRIVRALPQAMTPIYRFTPGTTPVLISVPHAGTSIPDEPPRPCG